jgi:Na+(H+)/acetate symporter ActP
VSISLAIFLAFVASTLGITYWASRHSRGVSAYFAAGKFYTVPDATTARKSVFGRWA